MTDSIQINPYEVDDTLNLCNKKIQDKCNKLNYASGTCDISEKDSPSFKVAIVLHEALSTFLKATNYETEHPYFKSNDIIDVSYPSHSFESKDIPKINNGAEDVSLEKYVITDTDGYSSPFYERNIKEKATTDIEQDFLSEQDDDPSNVHPPMTVNSLLTDEEDSLNQHGEKDANKANSTSNTQSLHPFYEGRVFVRTDLMSRRCIMVADCLGCFVYTVVMTCLLISLFVLCNALVNLILVEEEEPTSSPISTLAPSPQPF